MVIGIEKILPMQAKDWCESRGGVLLDYLAVGVHYFTGKKENLAEGLLKNVPDNAVIVTDYDFSTSISVCITDEIYWGQATGVALIPKKSLK